MTVATEFLAVGGKLVVADVMSEPESRACPDEAQRHLRVLARGVDLLGQRASGRLMAAAIVTRPARVAQTAEQRTRNA